MNTETIKAGQWVFTEGTVPQYFFFKLLSGDVSIYKRGRKIRSLTIEEGSKPIMLGVSAALRDDRLHMASVKADSDIVVERLNIDHIRGVLANEMPDNLKKNLAIMMESIGAGNEIVSLITRFEELERPDTVIPESMPEEAREILGEVKRLYQLITADVDKIIARNK